MAQKWLVEIVVADLWVADGFNLTDERAEALIEGELGYANSYEVGARVIRAPAPEIIEGLQDGSIEIADDVPVTAGDL